METETHLAIGAPRGEEHVNSVLTDDLVREIRREHSRGVGCRRLARHYRVSPGHIYRIIKRRAWAHVEDNQTSAA